MNIIGRTPDGGILVALTPLESDALNKLKDACENKPIHASGPWPKDASAFAGYDFTSTFGAITAFTLAKFATNELRWLLEKFDKHLSMTPEGCVTNETQQLRVLLDGRIWQYDPVSGDTRCDGCGAAAASKMQVCEHKPDCVFLKLGFK